MLKLPNTHILFLLIILVSCNTNKKNIKQSTEKLENLTTEVLDLMKENKLSGMSIAVINNYEIIWNKEYGYKENGLKNEINKNTAYSTASITKAITATTCLILDEAKKIDIDRPIRYYLKRWSLPKSKYLEKTDLTIRHLLSHTGGTSHSGYADFYENDAVPSLTQILNGEGLPNYDKGIEILFEPGTDVYYSGGGYVIIQMALEDTLNKPFKDIVKETIFQPLKMNHTTLPQPNERGFSKNVAKVHNIEQQIIRTGLPICPQLAPSGTWSTAKDLALFAIETQKALGGQKTKVISSGVAKELSTIVTYKYAGGGALGWQRSYGFGNLDWLTIMGQNTGVGGEINISMKDGKGIVMLANGETKNRLPVFGFLRSKVINQLNWKEDIKLSIVPLDDTFEKNVVGSYLDFMYGDFEETVSIENENGELYITSQILKLLTGKPKNKMYHLGEYVFKIENYPNLITFEKSNNEIKTIKIHRLKNEREDKKWRIPIETLKTVKVKLVEAFSTSDFTEAKQTYKKIKNDETEYDFSNSLLELGVMFYKRNDIEKAIEILEFNHNENPENTDAIWVLAQVNERIGNKKETLMYYQLLLPKLQDKKDKNEIKIKIESLK